LSPIETEPPYSQVPYDHLSAPQETYSHEPVLTQTKIASHPEEKTTTPDVFLPIASVEGGGRGGDGRTSTARKEKRRTPVEEAEEEEAMMRRNGDRIAVERGHEGEETAGRAGERISGVGEEGVADLFGEISKGSEGGDGSVLEGVSDAFLMDLLWPGCVLSYSYPFIP
jgi:hypothetical protein